MKPANYPNNPPHLWEHFYQITRCPRPSKKEEKVRQYIIEVATKNNLKYKTDTVGNVVIYVPATAGYENHETVIVQNHMDMVTDATPDRKINFEEDPIEIYIEDGWLKADRTTLGSDNGIGCATALATITDKSLKHPPLELLFTIDEETGLKGAWGVEAANLKGKKMLNLDTEEWGSLYIGCAGGIDYHLKKKYPTVKTEGQTYLLKAGGFSGGHSGIDIHKGRINAIKSLVNLLVRSNLPFQFASVKAGKAHNIIPRDAQFFINIQKNDLAKWHEVIASEKQIIKSYATKKDEKFDITLTESENQNSGISLEHSKELIDLLNIFPHGAHGRLETDPNLVAISNNLAIVKLDQGDLFIETSLRFFDRKEIIQIENELTSLSRIFKTSLEHQSEYPSWKPAPENKLLEKVVSIYEKSYQQKPHITAIHAGLECGILRDKIGEIDAVSFGPTIMGAHSPQERLEISTVKPFWDLFTKILVDL